MSIKIKNVNIDKVIFKDCNSETDRKSSPHPTWLLPGIIHNLLLNEILSAIPSLNIKIEAAQDAFKKKILELNKNLELGFEKSQISELNVLPPKDKDMFDYFKENLFNGKTGPFKTKQEPSIIENCLSVLEIFEKNKTNLKKSATELNKFYFQNISKANDIEAFTNLVSVAYHSAKLYSKKENRIQLLNISNNNDAIEKEASINWWKVAGCDAIGGAFGGPGGAGAASGCSIVMQW